MLYPFFIYALLNQLHQVQGYTDSWEEEHSQFTGEGNDAHTQLEAGKSKNENKWISGLTEN